MPVGAALCWWFPPVRHRRRKETTMSRRTFLAALPVVAALVAVGMLSACGAGPAARPATKAARPVVAAVPDPHVVVLPEPDTSLVTLATVSPRRGNAVVGSFPVLPGNLWIDLNCLGAGALQVAFEPLDAFTMPCGDLVQVTKNEIALSTANVLKISVSAPGTIQWSMRLQR
jgi:hypothetical protein